MSKQRLPVAVLVLVGAMLHVQAHAQTESAPPGETTASEWQQLARELALVRHVRDHLAYPEDGVALSGDRRDLQRVVGRRLPAPPGTTTGPSVLHVIADLWHARVDTRTPFGMLGRSHAERLDLAERALSSLAAAGPDDLRARLLPEATTELIELRRAVQGMGELPEPVIDLALSVADAAAAGRPVPVLSPVYPGAWPPEGGGPSRYPPPGAGVPPGPRPPPPPGGVPAPPPPSRPGGTGGSAPLPPGYGPYAAAPFGGIVCQTERQQAGEAGTTDAMLRLADCWTRDRSWPGWVAQVVEALDWAMEFAAITGDCEAMDLVVRKIREFGAVPSPLPGDRERFADLARRAEAERAALRTRCR